MAFPDRQPIPCAVHADVFCLSGIDAGNAIHTALDDYNNGCGYADGVFYGGNP